MAQLAEAHHQLGALCEELILTEDPAAAGERTGPAVAHDARRHLGGELLLEPCGTAAGTGRGPALLSLGELEVIRDALTGRTSESSRDTGSIRTFEAMVADPRGHKWQQISRADLGVPGCGTYRVVPRLGIIGMLAGWWHVTLSSGCP